jgi:hypothetical protein
MESTSKRIKVSSDFKQQQQQLNNIEYKINHIGNLCLTLINNTDAIKINQAATKKQLEILNNKIEILDNKLEQLVIPKEQQQKQPISSEMMNAYC